MSTELEMRAREFNERYSCLLHDLRIFVTGLREVGLKDDANALDEIVSEAPPIPALSQQPSAVDADSVVATLCHSHKKFAEWWDDLGERRALLFMRALTDAMLAAAPKPEDAA